MADALADAQKKKDIAAAAAAKPAVADETKPFSYEEFYAVELEKKHQDKSYRYFNNINRLAGKFPVAHTGATEEEVTVLVRQRLLGNGQESSCPRYYTVSASKNMFSENKPKSFHSRTLDKYGHGAGGTRNIAGNGAMHLSLEQEVATLHRKEAALVFSSCYVANDATLSTLGSKLPGCVFFSDNMNHASMIQGMRHSGAKKVIFNHNDMEDLEMKLKQ